MFLRQAETGHDISNYNGRPKCSVNVRQKPGASWSGWPLHSVPAESHWICQFSGPPETIAAVWLGGRVTQLSRKLTFSQS